MAEEKWWRIWIVEERKECHGGGRYMAAVKLRPLHRHRWRSEIRQQRFTSGWRSTGSSGAELGSDKGFGFRRDLSRRRHGA